MKSAAAVAILSVLALTACEETATTSGAPTLGSASDLTEFEGARAGQAEMGIQALGYELIRTDGLDAFWLNRDTSACAKITTSDGRYSAVEMLAADAC